MSATVSCSNGRTASRIRFNAASSSSMNKGIQGRLFFGEEAANNAVLASTELRTRSVAGGNDQRLFERGHAFADFFERDHAECFHAQRDGDFADLVGAGTLDDEPADVISHAHGFNNSQASGVAGVLAPIAAATAV